jgi:hypothetical protein
MLKTMLIIPIDETRLHDIEPQKEYHTSISETLSRFVTHQIKTLSNFKQQNCLTLGFRTKSINSTSTLKSNIDLECYYINTLHTFFNNKVWLHVLNTFGEVFFKYALLQPMFISCENGCFLQLSGTPVNELVKTNTLPNIKLNDEKSNLFFVHANTEIPHYKIFYNIKSLSNKNILSKVRRSLSF